MLSFKKYNLKKISHKQLVAKTVYLSSYRILHILNVTTHQYRNKIFVPRMFANILTKIPRKRHDRAGKTGTQKVQSNNTSKYLSH